MGTPLVVVEDLRKAFVHMGRELHVLRGIDLTIDQGEVVAMVGPSGAEDGSAVGSVGVSSGSAVASGSVSRSGRVVRSGSTRSGSQAGGPGQKPIGSPA